MYFFSVFWPDNVHGVIVRFGPKSICVVGPEHETDFFQELCFGANFAKKSRILIGNGDFRSKNRTFQCWFSQFLAKIEFIEKT